MGRKSNKKKQRRSTTDNRVFAELGAPAFVIGNGTSRKDFDLKPLLDHGNLYGLNWFFRDEFLPTVIVTSDEPITRTIQKAHQNVLKQRKMYTWFPKPGMGVKKASSPEKFAAGPLATWTACAEHKSKKVFLIGMDFFGFGSKGIEDNGKINNLYAGEKHYTDQNVAPTYRNWQRRFQYVMKTFPNTEFWHVAPFEGKSPERLIGLPNFHAVSWEAFQDHIFNGAELVDELEKTEEDFKLAMEPNPYDLKAILERQIVGQENVIFQDLLSDKQVIEIRQNVNEFQAKSPQSMGAQITILGNDIMVPFAKNAPGQPMPTKEQIAAHVKMEQQQRKRIMQTYWAKTGLRPIQYPITQDMIDASKQQKQKAPGLTPPPPPPVAAAATKTIIPPPPPPVFQ